MEDFSSWAKVTGYNISFGQGITASPLQMVRAYGAICNDGVLTTPHFLLSKPQTGTWEEYESEKVIDDMEALAKLKSMMRGVVSSGTARMPTSMAIRWSGKRLRPRSLRMARMLRIVTIFVLPDSSMSPTPIWCASLAQTMSSMRETSLASLAI